MRPSATSVQGLALQGICGGRKLHFVKQKGLVKKKRHKKGKKSLFAGAAHPLDLRLESKTQRQPFGFLFAENGQQVII